MLIMFRDATGELVSPRPQDERRRRQRKRKRSRFTSSFVHAGTNALPVLAAGTSGAPRARKTGSPDYRPSTATEDLTDDLYLRVSNTSQQY